MENHYVINLIKNENESELIFIDVSTDESDTARELFDRIRTAVGDQALEIIGKRDTEFSILFKL